MDGRFITDLRAQSGDDRIKEELNMFGKVGVQALSNGAAAPVRISARGNLITAGGGKYTEATLSGRVFAGANQAVVTTVAGCTAAAWTGLGLANPTGSGINVIVHQFSWAQYVIATGEGMLALATTTDAGFAAQIAGRNRLWGGPASKAYLDDGATLTTAGVIEQFIATISHGAASVTYGQGVNVLDLDGSLVLPPGRAVITVTDIVQTSGFAFAFLWEEVAI
jgi:hypothetical protein